MQCAKDSDSPRGDAVHEAPDAPECSGVSPRATSSGNVAGEPSSNGRRKRTPPPSLDCTAPATMSPNTMRRMLSRTSQLTPLRPSASTETDSGSARSPRHADVPADALLLLGAPDADAQTPPPAPAQAGPGAYEHPSDAVARCLTRVYTSRLTTTSGGNVSVIDSEGAMWITPKGTDKGELVRAQVVHKARGASAEWVCGPGLRPSTEHEFHAAIYAARPDIRAILHAHSPCLVSHAVCGLAPPRTVTTRGAITLSGVATAEYAMPGTERLAAAVSRAFAGEPGAARTAAVVMLNHGVIVASPEGLSDAYAKLETVESCASIALKARMLTKSPPKTLSDENVAALWKGIALVRELVRPDVSMSAFRRTPSVDECEAREQLARFTRRLVAQRLFGAFAGTISARVSPDTFLVSPSCTDRLDFAPERFVAVRTEGALGATQRALHEPGKTPSASVLAHMAIYRAHPAVNCVIASDYTHNAMAFGVAAAGAPQFRSEVIPEGYLVLRNSAVAPFEACLCPERLAAAVSRRCPLVVVAHHAVYSTGATVLQAFDRLEVAESLAEAQVGAAAASLGPVNVLSEGDTRDIDETFG
eukprot:m51a1_g8440 putative fructose-bisphosphate aldolase (589) ;mRNA; f:369279-372297